MVVICLWYSFSRTKKIHQKYFPKKNSSLLKFSSSLKSLYTQIPVLTVTLLKINCRRHDIHTTSSTTQLCRCDSHVITKQVTNKQVTSCVTGKRLKTTGLTVLPPSQCRPWRRPKGRPPPRWEGRGCRGQAGRRAWPRSGPRPPPRWNIWKKKFEMSEIYFFQMSEEKIKYISEENI